MNNTPKRARKSAEAHGTLSIGEWLPHEELTLWDKNPRRNDSAVPRVVASIVRFGFVAPIVIWRSAGRMVAGHTRLKAIRSLLAQDETVNGDGVITSGPRFVPSGAPGPGLVPVRFHEFASEAEAELYAVADNRLGELAEWDEEKLGEIAARHDEEALRIAGLDEYVPEPEAAEPEAPPGDGHAVTRTLGSWSILQGDLRGDALAGFPDNHFDALLSDPPYGLSSGKAITWDDLAEMEAQGKTRSGGFMGKQWDIAVPGPTFWRTVFRVLKPGAPLLVFSGTRTYHRVACAMEDAGLELRDCISWLYASGFPKSLSIAKAIDKQRCDIEQTLQVTKWIREARDEAGVTNKDIDAAFGFAGMSSHWTSASSQPSVPTLEQIPTLLHTLGDPQVPDEIKNLIFTLNGRKGEPGDAWKTARVVGEYETNPPGLVGRQFTRRDALIRDPSANAAPWEGYGSALKPAWEPCLLARKPLDGTIAHNALTHGVGGINIDGTRIGYASDDDKAAAAAAAAAAQRAGQDQDQRNVYGKFENGAAFASLPNYFSKQDLGRWPANVILDPEAGAMLDAQSGDRPGMSGGGVHRDDYAGGMFGGIDSPGTARGDNGGASRFFYCPKPSRGEREAGLREAALKPFCQTCATETSWDSADRKQSDPTDSTSPKRATFVSAQQPTDPQSSRTSSRGKRRTGPSQTDTNSTTETKSAPTTDSTISSSSHQPSTSASTPDASASPTGSGSSRAASAESGSSSPPSTSTSAKKVGRATDAAGSATSDSLSKQSACDVCGGPLRDRGSHPTVKPVSLARYLATMLLPPPREDDPRRLLIPFSGSGSEMIGALLAGWDDVTGVERETEYIDIARARVGFAVANPREFETGDDDPDEETEAAE